MYVSPPPSISPLLPWNTTLICRDTSVGVASERCKEANAVMSKRGAYVILRALLNLPIELPDLPEGFEPCPAGVETVVFAEEIKSKGDIKLEVLASIG